MMNYYLSLKRYFYNVVILPIRFIPFMNLMFSVSAKVRSQEVWIWKQSLHHTLYHGVILGASSFRNEYDEHTIQESLEQVQRLSGKSVKWLAGDRGYRNKKEINETQILIPNAPKVKTTYYQRKKKHKLFCKCAGIEPNIGHLKTDYCLGRNFYKGVVGDIINVMLAAAAHNFKRALRDSLATR